MKELEQYREFVENWHSSQYVPNGSQNTVEAIKALVNPGANLSCSACVGEMLDDAYNKLIRG